MLLPIPLGRGDMQGCRWPVLWLGICFREVVNVELVVIFLFFLFFLVYFFFLCHSARGLSPPRRN
jgi:hypothetical protein